MTAKIHDLNLHKKRDAESSETSPEEVLRMLLEDIQNGVIDPKHALVMVIEVDEEGYVTPHRYTAKMNYAQEIAYLEYWSRSVLKDWMG